MTPEVENILRSIGWDVAKRAAPLFAESLAAAFRQDVSVTLSHNDAEARTLAKKISSLKAAAEVLAIGLADLPGTVRRSMAFSALSLQDALALAQLGSNTALPDIATDAEDFLASLISALEATEERLRREGGVVRKGAPRNLVPHAVAYAAAQIYLIGRGELPVAHNVAAGQEIAGFYGKTVEQLFQAMGLGYDAIGPAQSAIARLSALPDEEFSYFLLLRCPLTRDLVEVGFRSERLARG